MAGPGGGLALELLAIHKRFGDVAALAGVNLRVRTGSVHALLGENGAGKSTLMRVAVGLAAADSGTVAVCGNALRRHTVRQATAAGLGMVHQHLSLAESLTALENVALGGDGLFRPRELRARLREVSRNSGLEVPLDVRASALSLAQRQQLEILKAIASDARVLILDEPTAVLAPSEVAGLLEWIRRFAAGGGSVVLVTHKLREALAVANDVTVLRRGTVTLAGPAAECTPLSLARAVFPDDDGGAPTTSVPAAGEEVVRAAELAVADARGAIRIRGASIGVRRSEILGVAAIEGSGHHELLEALGGLRRPHSGTLSLPPRVAVIPADRHRDGVVLSMTLAENVALRGLGAARGRVSWTTVRERTNELVRRFGIVAPSSETRLSALSGGNQQRLVLAAALERPVDLLVADNPTRGLDLVATRFVHDQLRAAAAGGAAVVVHSSDLDEVLSLATRVVVVYNGHVVEAGLDRDHVGRKMLGAA